MHAKFDQNQPTGHIAVANKDTISSKSPAATLLPPTGETLQQLVKFYERPHGNPNRHGYIVRWFILLDVKPSTGLGKVAAKPDSNDAKDHIK